MADQPVTFQAWDAIDRFQVWRAIDIICQGVDAVPQKSADADHERWLRFLIDILARLERHAKVGFAVNMTTREGVSPIRYAQSSKETAVANFVSDLVIIRDWIKIQWTCAAQGKNDLTTVAYSSYAARKLARQVLYSVELEIGWKDPIFLDYAIKAGLFSNENDDVGEHMHAPKFENSCGSNMPAQLKRWLFCAAIAGWDVDQALTAAQDRCLLAPLTT
ncbi:hypothetical protein V499_02287 [Pseudogymnoascus sp. VKM F-103]|nr:hypothetical protein V499_02287 [Pseudogymnoascus sp. VKM F-103]